ncbi:MAG: hypothetical protein K8T89_24490 [Planctomycetes bacterium]|nr:hypothetical protein [Planctomycetota bacterium]
MNSGTDNPQPFIQAKIEAIVAQGDEVRKKVSELVTGSADNLHFSKQGMIDLSRSVMEGATAALDKAVPKDPQHVLRQVIDGLGDGLSTAALATRLAMEEAKAQNKSFADEDLSKMTADLRTVGDLFVDTVSQTAKKFKSISAAELGALRTHSEQTVKRLLPSINSTIAAIAERPLQFGKESFEAGISLSKQALGSLFGAVGRRMEEASKRLTGEESAK